jgi:hypothetical protein
MFRFMLQPPLCLLGGAWKMETLRCFVLAVGLSLFHESRGPPMRQETRGRTKVTQATQSGQDQCPFPS